MAQEPSKPDYALGGHTASIGLAFVSDELKIAPFLNGAMIGQHGSWNRRQKAGYKVVFVPFNEAGMPTGELPIDFLSGFLKNQNEIYGRPAGVTLYKNSLLVCDDSGGVVWQVSPDQ
jgi:glucose/arabinose dehydrogenase